MWYLFLKSMISGVLIMTVSEVAKRNPSFRSVGRFPATRVGVGDDLAVAGNQGRRTACSPCRVYLLDGTTLAADVLSTPLSYPPRHWILSGVGSLMRYDRDVVFFDGLAVDSLWY
jgi:hypothetical protein